MKHQTVPRPPSPGSSDGSRPVPSGSTLPSGPRARPEVKQRYRAGHLMRKYGMTIGQYDAMLEAQGGGCFICGRPPREDISLHGDHDHSTGRVRGILCFCCNNALADFQEDPQLLRKAVAYLAAGSDVVQEEIGLARACALSLRAG